jgi:hypothetical protein
LSTETAPEASAAPQPAAAWSGKAVIGFACAVIALVTPAPFSLIAAVLAISSAVLSRRDLRTDLELRGTALSLFAFLLGSAVLLFGLIPAIPAVLPFLLRF